MNLILFEPGEVASGGEARLTGARAAHVIQVLGASPGRELRVGLVDGPRGAGVVTAVSASEVRLHCTFERDIPEPARVDLLLALPRPKVLRRLWAQVAALGVGRIVLTNAARVERPYFDTHVLTPACYRPLLIEGLQQARDTRLPQVSIHRQFRRLIEDDLDALCPSGLRLVADPAGPVSPESARREGDDGRVLVAVGPEGGWNAFEIDLLRRHRFQPVSLGPRTLRSDTACIAVLARLGG